MKAGQQRTIVLIPADASDATSVYFDNFVWHVRTLVSCGVLSDARIVVANNETAGTRTGQDDKRGSTSGDDDSQADTSRS